MRKFKKILSLSMAIVLIATVGLQSMVTVHAGKNATVWVENSLIKVFKSTQAPTVPKTTMEIVSAKNEYRSSIRPRHFPFNR
ncbi:MAG: hypothetical protein RR444_08065 [Oscillospiraceae bacterium]